MSDALHWADTYAEKIVREKGDRDLYVCASGITPSGTVHIGNFREIISVELVVRALRELGKKVRFVYSWDDYDVFRKVPANMPDRDALAEFLRKPITLTPDPYGKEESYARHNEREIEDLLPVLGIFPEYIYQARAYRASQYAEGIRKALEHRELARTILNEHREKNRLAEDWWPITVFCGACSRDTTRVDAWDGQYGVSYGCTSCGHSETVDLRSTGAVKLFWRIDWPMRWAHERVDFEPAGKDHHSRGGSFDTGRRIVEEIYGFPVPTTFPYEFIGTKGGPGKISSSSGEVVPVREVLEIYQPELVRYLFVSTRPNAKFDISFDLDVIKNYEDYDRCERTYFGREQVAEAKAAKQRRIYELSQVRSVPERMPTQVPFRHLCNLLQIQSGDIERVIAFLALDSSQEDLARVRARAACAWNWITEFAPESFRWALRAPGSPAIEVSDSEQEALRRLREEIVEHLADFDEKGLGEAIYALAEPCGLEAKELFRLVYRALIDQDAGPRLAGFLLIVGRERVKDLLAPY